MLTTGAVAGGVQGMHIEALGPEYVSLSHCVHTVAPA
jgi:hypothetical protein